jgi:ABC-type thiamine transport system ATPase subunit
VLSESQHLLALPGYHLYAELAPVPVDEPIWQLRAASLRSLAGEAAAPLDRAALLGVALTSTPHEGSQPELAEQTLTELSDGPTSAEREMLEQMLSGLWRPFAADRVHPHLSWRENLVFGVPVIESSRAGRQVEQILLELLEQQDLKEPFTRLGLRCDVGRQGGNLSGGQGQLVALSRALLRRCPVAVLDEPTSALDPASRARVAELLGQWKAGRVVITVSHDPELVRHADQVRLMEGGRLVGSGTFQELLEQSESFRNIMRQS